MKTIRINNTGRFTGLVVALALFAGFAGAARGQDTGSAKGGATKLLQLNGRLVTPRPEPDDLKAMSCAKCTDEVVQVRETGTKGGARALRTGAPLTKSVLRHGCKGCGSDWIVSGHGKAKASTAVHRCSSCGAANLACCSTSRSGVAATPGMGNKYGVAPVK